MTSTPFPVEPSWRLTDGEYARVQQTMPIACVDAFAIRPSSSGGVQVGLILRETFTDGLKWALVGGRLRRGETVQQALHREWRSAFGTGLGDARVAAAPTVVEFHPGTGIGGPYDPRQHALSLTYPVRVDHDLTATGVEALEFAWFDPADLTRDVMGFGIETVMPRLIAWAASMGLLTA